jgi:hypothetical protein
VDDPWPTVDAYDDRSWVENGLFRNSKQFWRLTRWFPQKTAAGVRSHLTFVMLLVATATAYRLWDKAQSGAIAQPPDRQIDRTTYRVVVVDTGEVRETLPPDRPALTHLASAITPPPAESGGPASAADAGADFLAHSLLGGQGALRWRRQLQRENRDQVIVFIGQHYGIFDTHVFLVLSGIPLRELPPHLGSRAEILRHYGCTPNAATGGYSPDT